MPATTRPRPSASPPRQPGSSFECKVDSGSYAACSSPKTTAHLADGSSHLLRPGDRPGWQPRSHPGHAHSFTVRTASVGLSGTTLVVTAATGAKDNLAITRPSASTLRVTDLAQRALHGFRRPHGRGLHPSGDYTANCSAASITRSGSLSGDQADKVTNSTAVQSSLYGGDGGRHPDRRLRATTPSPGDRAPT